MTRAPLAFCISRVCHCLPNSPFFLAYHPKYILKISTSVSSFVIRDSMLGWCCYAHIPFHMYYIRDAIGRAHNPIPSTDRK
ncbi:hypothetical protein BDB00DRAFT_796843 [Zychaea mexicana]|uniref:uncharacterized protein n=1 Tax=Zychaea mexicana TaxID=64656 RepID=UPI0022FE10AC|nr:uncharacterized protein BDB00DRAFT_796843 [Zychaea mexicana]KAI9498833.1 hypothetical protein BDB00DRAFT_796843 [Zychaea mexicana]